jgi:hypothetical protein
MDRLIGQLPAEKPTNPPGLMNYAEVSSTLEGGIKGAYGKEISSTEKASNVFFLPKKENYQMDLNFQSSSAKMLDVFFGRGIFFITGPSLPLSPQAKTSNPNISELKSFSLSLNLGFSIVI